jgi:hypothetical protein
MYIIVTLILICVFAAIVNGIRLSISHEPNQQRQELSDEERLKRIYRNAYYSWVSLKDEL